jgi:hypothetical protein
MASQKALYWMAVGLLALIMGNHFVSKFEGNCLAYKARAAADRISSKADRLMALADVMSGRTSTQIERAQTVMVMTQTRLASVQSGLTRQEAACARLEGSRARMMVLQQLEHVQIPVVCPRPRAGFVIPLPPVTPGEDPI